jgi:predicted DNA-binding protein (MmcQ/YjbR family)
MTVDRVQKYCLSLPGVEETIKWENHLCFCIGEKMFFVVNPDHHPVTGSFKASDEDFTELISTGDFIPAPYMAKHKWVYFNTLNCLPEKKWQHYIKNAYQIVFDRLPLKTRKRYS